MAKTRIKEKPSREDTKSCLLSAAMKLFAARGFDGTTVKELADHAGVNVSLISYHYLSKEGLYQACLQQCGQERLAATQKLLQPANSLEELRVRLRLFVQDMLDYGANNPDHVRMILREIESDGNIPEDLFRETFLKHFTLLVEFIKAAQKSGYVSKDLDPQTLSGMIQGQVSHHVRMDAVKRRFYGLSITDPKYREKLTQQTLEVFLNGIVQRPPLTGKATG